MNEINKAKVMRLFKEYLCAMGLIEVTIKRKLYYAECFFAWCKKNNASYDLRDITKQEISQYIIDLKSLERRDGRDGGLGGVTQNQHVTAVKQIFECLYSAELLLTNPCSKLEIKKEKQSKRKVYLNSEEMNRLLEGITEGYGWLRDRTLFELCYSSGFRIGEVLRLKVEDIDFENRMVLIKRGKNNKDRIEPINEPAVVFLKKYLGQRIMLKNSYVFAGRMGGHLGKSTVNNRLRYWAKKAEVLKKGLSPHSIRHSTAVNLLENGADIRYVQELLGHESIESTVIYTHSMTEGLRKVYKSYHPRENMYCAEADDEYMKKIETLKFRCINERWW